MKITICGSMVFARQMLETQKQLETMGHQVLIPIDTQECLENPSLQEDLNHCQTFSDTPVDKDHFEKISQSDAVLVLNYPKNNISGYIGGATLTELGIARYLDKKIFILNELPSEAQIRYVLEIKLMKPTILRGDLSKINTPNNQKNDMLDFLEKIEGTMKELMTQEDRQDVEFRYGLLAGEIGDLAKYITHDQILNPNARTHGNKQDEHMAYGQAFIQLINCAHLREIDIKKAIEMATQNMQSAEWRKVAALNQDKIIGYTAVTGEIEGIAYVDHSLENLSELDNHILVTDYISPKHLAHFDKISGLVTNHGSLNSHPAILAREYNIPFLVGTGNATQKIKHGQKIKIINKGYKGEIVLLDSLESNLI